MVRPLSGLLPDRSRLAQLVEQPAALQVLDALALDLLLLAQRDAPPEVEQDGACGSSSASSSGCVRASGGEGGRGRGKGGEGGKEGDVPMIMAPKAPNMTPISCPTDGSRM